MSSNVPHKGAYQTPPAPPAKPGKPGLFGSIPWVVVAMLFAGCGGNNPDASRAASEQPRQASPALKVSRDNPCSVMFPSEVGEILGLTSQMREHVDEITCRYHFEPVGGTQTRSSREETFIEVKVHWTSGRTAVTAARLAGRLLGGRSSGFEQLSGIGDQAWLAPIASYLAFSKGDVGVEIDMRMLPGEKEKAIRLARLIASRV